jgi:glycogen debranching enzyme
MARGEREHLVQYPVSCTPQAWAAGALFMLLQGTLGLDPDAVNHRLRIWNPRLPPSIRRLELHGVRVGRSRLGLRFARTGERTHCDVLDIKGQPLRVEIEIG